MRIEENTIFFKSIDDLYFKELAGIKPNTVRFFDRKTYEAAVELSEMEDFVYRIAEDTLYIEISNAINPHLKFKRTIRDISLAWGKPHKKVWVISWFHEENGVTTGYNAPVRY